MAYGNGPELTYLQLEAGNNGDVHQVEKPCLRLAVMFDLLGVGGPVRELVVAVGRQPGGAHVPAQLGVERARGHVHLLAMDLVQHLHADRLRRAESAQAGKNAILIVEFAKAAARRGSALGRRRWERRGCGTAADPDDVVRVHPRRGAAWLASPRAPGGKSPVRWGSPSSGMCSVTLFGIFLTPVFYYVIQLFGVEQAPKPTTMERRSTLMHGNGLHVQHDADTILPTPWIALRRHGCASMR